MLQMNAYFMFDRNLLFYSSKNCIKALHAQAHKSDRQQGRAEDGRGGALAPAPQAQAACPKWFLFLELLVASFTC